MIAALIMAACSWNNPGHNPYSGEVPAAIDSYKDIPAEVRKKLKARMEKRKYDDLAVIRRDSIDGYDTSYSDLRSMHFGKGSVCTQVSRSGWAAKHEEIGLVYCEAEHCVIVPTVCRNVSRVTRVAQPADKALPSVTVIGGLPPGGNFSAHQPTFRTPAPWIVAFPGPSYFFPVPLLRPVDVVPAAPVVQPPKTVAPTWPPRFPPIASAPVPEVSPSAPVVSPPITPPWIVDQPVSPPVPEPSTWALILVGLSSLFAFSKSKKAVNANSTIHRHSRH